MSTLAEMIEALQSEWRKTSQIPNCNSFEEGYAKAHEWLARELAPILAAARERDQVTEKLVRKVRSHVNASVGAAVEGCAKHRPYWKGLALVCACGKWTYASYTDKEGTKVQEQWEAHIRTLYPAATGELERRLAEARAGMREACAKAMDDELSKLSKEEDGKDEMHPLIAGEVYGWTAAKAKCLSLPDSAADEAIERIKAEARLEEAKTWMYQRWGNILDSISLEEGISEESALTKQCRYDYQRIAFLTAAAKGPSHD